MNVSKKFNYEHEPPEKMTLWGYSIHYFIQPNLKEVLQSFFFKIILNNEFKDI